MQHEEIWIIAFTRLSQQVSWKTRTRFSEEIYLFITIANNMPTWYTGHTLKTFLLNMRFSNNLHFIFHTPANVCQHVIFWLWERNETWITYLTFIFFECLYVFLPSAYKACTNTETLTDMAKQCCRIPTTVILQHMCKCVNTK